MTPFSFAENFKAENSTQELQLGIDEKYIKDLQGIGKLFRDWYSTKDTVNKLNYSDNVSLNVSTPTCL